MKRALVVLSFSTLMTSTSLSAAYYSSGTYEATAGNESYDRPYYRDNTGYYYAQNQMSRDGYTYANAAMATPSGQPSTTTPETAQKDRELVKRIQQALEGDGLKQAYRSVTINVANGVVTITGTMVSSKDRQELKNKINSVPGVVRIEDRLEVEDASMPRSYKNNSSSYYRDNSSAVYDSNDNEISYNDGSDSLESNADDRLLRLKIQDNLKDGKFGKPYPNIQIDVREGNVTARGTVASDSDRRDVMNRIKNIPGVRQVDNQLTLQIPTQASPSYNSSANSY